jgi:hypothetical protein
MDNKEEEKIDYKPNQSPKKEQPKPLKFLKDSIDSKGFFTQSTSYNPHKEFKKRNKEKIKIYFKPIGAIPEYSGTKT